MPSGCPWGGVCGMTAFCMRPPGEVVGVHAGEAVSLLPGSQQPARAGHGVLTERRPCRHDSARSNPMCHGQLGSRGSHPLAAEATFHEEPR